MVWLDFENAKRTVSDGFLKSGVLLVVCCCWFFIQPRELSLFSRSRLSRDCLRGPSQSVDPKRATQAAGLECSGSGLELILRTAFGFITQRESTLRAADKALLVAMENVASTYDVDIIA